MWGLLGHVSVSGGFGEYGEQVWIPRRQCCSSTKPGAVLLTQSVSGCNPTTHWLLEEQSSAAKHVRLADSFVRPIKRFRKITQNGLKQDSLKVVWCAANQRFTGILKYSSCGSSSQTGSVDESGFIYFVSLRLWPRRLHKNISSLGGFHLISFPPYFAWKGAVFWNICCPGKGSCCRCAPHQKAI